MRNLFRKSVIILAGLGLLFFYSCQTVSKTPSELEDITLDNMFTSELTTSVYIDINENQQFLNEFIQNLELEGESDRVIKSSNSIFIGINSSDEGIKFSSVVLGNFSKFQFNLGLTFSKDWKKKRVGERKIWVNSQGLKLYVLSSTTVVISNTDINSVIETLENGIITQPKEPILLKIPKIRDELTQSLTMGFISGGVESLIAKGYPTNSGYLVNSELGFLTESKANGFRLLLNIFLRVLGGSNGNNTIGDAIEDLEITSRETTVYLDNLQFSRENIMNLLNNLIFQKGETDK